MDACADRRKPFRGLQGGAVAGLLTAEVEVLSGDRGWGVAVSASVHFLRSTPPGELRTKLSVVCEGGRVTVIDSTVFVDDDPEPTATARVLLLDERPVDISDLSVLDPDFVHPDRCEQVRPHARHDRPWFMDAMDVRRSDDGSVTWFRLRQSVVEDAGPLARVLGPADSAHGLERPAEGVAADWNLDLAVHLSHTPRGEWIGVRAGTTWDPESGFGHGRGVLLDESGEIGSVSMSVALVPFPP